jgi:hypothetical protein
MRWDYHTLSTACWGAHWQYQHALRVWYSQCHTLRVRWEYHSRWEYDTLTLRVSYSQRLTVTAMKKTRISDCQYWQYMTLVNSASTVPPIGLPPTLAKFCHTLTRFLVGSGRRHALSWLYFYSSVAGHWLVGCRTAGQRSTDHNKGCLALGGFPLKV